MTGAARAPHIASLAFPGLPAEPLLHALEARGVFASAGSACASRTAGPSPALVAIGIDDRTGVLRFSLSRHTTAADIDAAVVALAAAVAELARPLVADRLPNPLPARGEGAGLPPSERPSRGEAPRTGLGGAVSGRTRRGMDSVVVCRYGELFLKSGNRRVFERVLADNARRALADMPAARVVADARPAARAAARGRGRRRRHPPAARVRAGVAVGRAPGRRHADLAAIEATAVDTARAAIARDGVASFKIEARRADKRFPVTSMEMARRIGARVQADTGLAVDVHKPALRLGIEVGTGVAFVFAGTQAAPGGLPVGASGRALLLLSGGIDSPVAGWLAAKRGLALDAVYFHSPPYVGEKSRDKVLTLAGKLARWQALRSVTVVPFTEVQKRLRDAGPAELAVVLYRRMMMRIADAIADRPGFERRW